MNDEDDSGSDQVRIERAAPRHAALVSDLFTRADVPCFCQYYQFEGDHRDWQNRCANARDTSRVALESEIESENLNAWVARYRDQVVGWTRVRTPAEMTRAYDGRLYRGLPCFSGERDNVFTLSCFLIDPHWRRQGLATELLHAVTEWARDRGASALEALPRGSSEVTDEEQWMGPLAMYEEAGFETVHAFAPYPVLRLSF